MGERAYSCLVGVKSWDRAGSLGVEGYGNARVRGDFEMALEKAKTRVGTLELRNVGNAD